jgi:hypothetical protein
MAAVAAVVLTLAVGSMAAYAYFTSTGTGTGSAATGSATTWTVGNVGTSGTMYPGAGTATLTYQVTNAGSGHQAVTGVSVTVASSGGNIINDATGSAVAGCSASWFSAAASTFKASDGTTTVTAPVDLAGSDYITGTSTVTMANVASSQDACQGFSPRLTISVS